MSAWWSGVVEDYEAPGILPDLDRVDAGNAFERDLDLVEQLGVAFGGGDFQAYAAARGMSDLGRRFRRRLYRLSFSVHVAPRGLATLVLSGTFG